MRHAEDPAAPGSWAERASCRHTNLNMSMPDHLPSSGAARDLYIEVRRRMCHDCPVYDDCRTWALTVPDPAVGMIAAGMTPKERRNARRNP